MQLDANVIIVGGGPAGLATALFLAAADPGLRERIVVLEKKRYPRDKPCAGAMGSRADRALARIGVSVDVPSVPFDGMVLTTTVGRVERRTGGLGRVVRRLEFDARLAEIACARGIRVLDGTGATAVDYGPGGVSVETPLGTLRGEVLVGADGVGSTVRRAMGLPQGTLRAQVVEVDTPVTVADLSRDIVHFDLADRTLRGYAWDFPTVVDGEPLVSRGVYALRSGDTPGEDVGVRLDRRLEAQGLCPAALSKTKRFSERGFEPHRAASDMRTLLVGEAAGIDALTGEGIAQAIEYGEAAARYLARKLATRDLGFRDWKRHLVRSRLGIDLLVRRSCVELLYDVPRPFMEGYLSAAPEMLGTAMAWFSGTPIPWGDTLTAVARLVPYAARRASEDPHA